MYIYFFSVPKVLVGCQVSTHLPKNKQLKYDNGIQDNLKFVDVLMLVHKELIIFFHIC